LFEKKIKARPSHLLGLLGFTPPPIFLKKVGAPPVTVVGA